MRKAIGTSLLTALGIEPRAFLALAKTLILIDLRGQHFARATATKPHYKISPLFWVVGQCLTASAITSLVLFRRVDVFFYAFVGLVVSVLVTATTLLVEFNEVVLDPRDLDIIGHRPVSPRTYAAARFANLLFYVALMYLALNIFPLIVGAGLKDAGLWYAPAYLVASLAATVATVAMVIVILSLGGMSDQLEPVKEVLAWTQIILVLVVGYGAQLKFRNNGHALEVWAAFPPPWVAYLPPTWLARFVERAAVSPDLVTLGIGLALAAGSILCGGLVVWRIAQLYRRMQPVTSSRKLRPMPLGRIGGLAGGIMGIVARSRAERVGFWLCRTLLRREMDLKMRCLLPMNLAVAVVILGLATGQFADPLRAGELQRIVLPILAVYLVALAVPPILFNLTFSRDSEAWWALGTAPLERPAGLARGMAKAVMVTMVWPLCVALALVMGFAWRDPIGALLHGVLAAVLCWLAALATLWLVQTEPLLSLPPTRGAALGPLVVPMAAFSAVAMSLAGLHVWFAPSPAFWGIAGIGGLIAWPLLERKATARSARLLEVDA